MPRDTEYLLDIAQAARQILEFKRGVGYAAFLHDTKTQSAIVCQLLVIGEAVKRLTPEFTAAHPAIPWQAIARMRDKLIHHYRRTNPQEVWNVAETDIPQLLTVLEPILPPA